MPAIREYSFQPRQRVISGEGSVARLTKVMEKLGKKRAFILTGNTLATQTSLVRKLEEMLGDSWVGTFAGCVQHVLASTVDEAAGEAEKARPDILVSFGGGSPTDTTKIVAHRLLGDGPRESMPQVVIPTTLSAGEFTAGAGITNEETRQKGAVADARILPTVVILDPEMTVETPRRLWASTGIKALDHAIEALWSVRAHPVTDTMAMEAIRRLHARLPESLDPKNLAARLDCQIAAWMSIFGAANVGMRLSHPLGHQIGARWNVPHGITSCIVLPTVMRFLAPSTCPAQEKIAQAFGCDTKGKGPEEVAESAAAAVEGLVKSLDLPARLSQAGAVREELPAVAKAVSHELAVRTRGGPTEIPSEQEILGILESVW